MNKEKRKKKIIQIIRLILQVASFIFLPALYYNAFNGIRLLFTAIIRQDMTSVGLMDVIGLIVVIPLTLLLGRFFCGWMCAFGSFFDFIYLLAHRIFKFRFRMNEKADAVLKNLKYVCLVAVMVLVWWLGLTVFSSANPWDVFGMIATVGKMPALTYAVTELTAGFVIFCLLIIVSAFYERFFCRYLCPLGAIFTLISKLRLTRIAKPTEKCGKCRICTNNCSMGIPLYKKDKIASGECINCMRCVEVCPRSNVSFTVSGKNMNPLVAGTVAAAAMTGVYLFGMLPSYTDGAVGEIVAEETVSVSETTSVIDETTLAESTKAVTEAAVTVQSTEPSIKTETVTEMSEEAETTTEPSEKTETGKYKDGTYTGTGTGFRGATTTVTVDIENGEIVDISVISYGDDRQFFERAFTEISGDIIKKKTTDVDTVSGATFSSNGILEAVAAALGLDFANPNNSLPSGNHGRR